MYTTPELSLTVTGAPIISLRNPDGSRPSLLEPFSIPEAGCRSFLGVVVAVDGDEDEVEIKQVPIVPMVPKRRGLSAALRLRDK